MKGSMPMTHIRSFDYGTSGPLVYAGSDGTRLIVASTVKVSVCAHCPTSKAMALPVVRGPWCHGTPLEVILLRKKSRLVFARCKGRTLTS